MADSQYPWIRRDGESNPAYEAFRIYLLMGSGRTMAKVGKELGKHITLLEGWSVKHEWGARTLAYDQHTATADTDGLVHVLAEFRDENIALARKLRTHLSDRLDDFIAQRADPTVRWTQALTALAKLEANALLMNRDDKKTDERVMKLEEALAKLEDVDA